MFQNQEIPVDDLPQAESVVWIAMDKKYLWRKLVDSLITYVLVIAGVIVFQTVTGIANDAGDWPLAPGWIGLAIVLAAIPLFSWPPISVPKIGYALRDKDIVYKSGVFWQTVTAVPFNRIQHVEKSSTPLDRKFHLASLQLFTAGGSGGDLSIHGLPAKTAEKLRSFILEKVGSSVE